MLYSYLKKCTSLFIMCWSAVTLSSCSGNVNVDEVILEDCIKVPAQTLTFSEIRTETEDGETFNFFETSITLEAVKILDEDDYDWAPSISMYLLDKNGAELLELGYEIDGALLESQGYKKLCTFGMYTDDCLKSIEQLETIIKNTKSVRFSSEIKD